MKSGSAILTIGFGTVVGMWALAYLGRLPVVLAPAWVLSVALVAGLGGGGYALGRLASRGALGGAQVGLVVAIVNLLILGSIIGGEAPNELRPSAWYWIPGSVLASTILGAIGAEIGRRGRRLAMEPGNWIGGFAVVAVIATGLLVIAGGVVTGQQAGLAVTDWPNSFTYNMFLFPLSKMSGSIYYEHAHRLLGTLVGLTTLTLAWQVWRWDSRAWMKWLLLAAVILVVAQGTLGGLRVTGFFTLSADPEVVAPSIALAVLHGIVGQVFLALLVCVAAFLSTAWQGGPPAMEKPAVSTDRLLANVAMGVLISQLAAGAMVRHMQAIAFGDLPGAPADPAGLYQRFLILHILLAALVTVVVLAVGLRASVLYATALPVHRLGRWLVRLVVLQLGLGILTLVATTWDVFSLGVDALVSTLHQGTGAALLALCAALGVWTRRALRPS